MKKLLFVIYYWPPAGGPGSQRAVKFTKYLPEFGWQPIILTVKRGEFPYLDPSLKEDIPKTIKTYRTKSWEPFLFYKKVTGRKTEETLPVGLLTWEKGSINEKIAAWVRANIFVPDARIGWFPFAVYMGLKIIKKEEIDLIFTSSPPHSLQLIGMTLKYKTGLPWVCELRDPWIEIRYYQYLKRLFWTEKLDTALERRTLLKADQVITVSDALSRGFKQKLGYVPNNKFNVVPNGYDELDYEALGEGRVTRFKIIHTGNLLAHQNPRVLWRSLQQIFQNYPKIKQHLKIVLIGKIHKDILKSLRDYNFKQYVEIQGFIPHRQVLKEITTSTILLLVVPEIENNEGIVTGKLFEYIGSGKPILGIGPPKGDAGKIISKFKQSIICDYQDVESCYGFIERMYKLWLKDTLPESDLRLRRPYSRKILTQNLAEQFNRLIEKNCKQ